MFYFRPARAVFVTSNTSIRHCIDMMGRLPSSYVMVKNRHGQLVGIFTDFDIRKKFRFLRKENNLDRPISTVMKRPLRMLTLKTAHKAAEFMVKHDVRHIPIVEKSGGSRNLVGVITMKQLFRDIVSTGVLGNVIEGRPEFTKPFKVGLLSPDGSSFHKFREFFSMLPKFYVDRIWLSKMQDEYQMQRAAKKFDLVLFDIDSLKKSQWLPVIEYFNRNEHLMSFGVIYTPDKHAKNMITLLRKLKVSGRFYVYAKPIDLTDLLLDIEEARDLNE